MISEKAYEGCYSIISNERYQDVSDKIMEKDKLTMEPALCDEKCATHYPDYGYFGLYNQVDMSSGLRLTICKCGTQRPVLSSTQKAASAQTDMECDYPCYGDETARCGTVSHDSMAVYQRVSRRRRLSVNKDYDYYINQISRAQKIKNELHSTTKLTRIQKGDNTVIKIIYALESPGGSYENLADAKADQILQDALAAFAVCTKPTSVEPDFPKYCFSETNLFLTKKTESSKLLFCFANRRDQMMAVMRGKDKSFRTICNIC